MLLLEHSDGINSTLFYRSGDFISLFYANILNAGVVWWGHEFLDWSRAKPKAQRELLEVCYVDVSNTGVMESPFD